MQVEAFRFSSRLGLNLSCFSALSRRTKSSPYRGAFHPLEEPQGHPKQRCQPLETESLAIRQNSDDKGNSMRKGKAQPILWAVFRCSSCEALARLHVFLCHEGKGFCFLSRGDDKSMPTFIGSALGPSTLLPSRFQRRKMIALRNTGSTSKYLIHASCLPRLQISTVCQYAWEPHIHYVFLYPLRDSFHNKYHQYHEQIIIYVDLHTRPGGQVIAIIRLKILSQPLRSFSQS